MTMYDPVDDAVGPPSAETEQEARARGWVTIEEWTAEGKDPELWRDADEFLEFGRGNVRQVRNDYEQRMAELQAQNQSLQAQLARTSANSDEALRLSRDAANQGRETRARDIRQQIREATERGDADEVIRLSDELAKVPAPQAPVAAPPTQPVPGQPNFDPVVDAWVQRNKHWFQADARLNEAMKANHGIVCAEMPRATKIQQLDAAKERTRAQFPQDFAILDDQNTGGPPVAPSPAAAPAPRAATPAVAAPTSRGIAPRETPHGLMRITDAAERALMRREFEKSRKSDPGLTEDEFVELCLNKDANPLELRARRKA